MNGRACRFMPEALLLDVPEIDVEHEAIFNLLVTLKVRCLDEEAPDPVLAERIVIKLREHFSTEERIARQCNMDFSGHAQQHEDLLRILTKAVLANCRGTICVFSLLRYVEYWFERHINDEDKRLAERLHARALVN